MKDFEFYQDLDFRYPEIAICLENSNKNIAKFFIPILTPLLNADSPYDDKDKSVNKNNILNDSSSMNITKCTLSNYIKLRLPKNIMEINHDEDGNLITKYSCKKGDKFVVSFIGGNPNNPCIIGRYYDVVDQ